MKQNQFLRRSGDGSGRPVIRTREAPRTDRRVVTIETALKRFNSQPRPAVVRGSLPVSIPTAEQLLSRSSTRRDTPANPVLRCAADDPLAGDAKSARIDDQEPVKFGPCRVLVDLVP